MTIYNKFKPYILGIASCILITTLGIVFLVMANPGTTTIGEDISTAGLTATGTISLPNNSITDAMTVNTLTASNYLPLLGGTIAGDLVVDDTISEGGTSLIEKYLGITDKASDSDKLDNQDSTYFTNAGNLASGVVGTQYGGTGLDWSAIAQGSLPYFSAEGTMSNLDPGTTGQFLKSQGTSAPTWTNVARTATFVVASSATVNGSSILSQQQADYVCNGTNDQVEIQAAINAANTAGGGKVLLMEGTYNIAEALSAISNLIIEGNGIGVTNIICSNKNTVFFNNPGATIENIVLKGFSINGQGDVGAQGGSAPITFYNIVNFLIEDVYIEKGGWHNFYISQGSKNGVINRCLSTQSWDDNFAIGGSDTSVERISVTNCISWDSFTSWSDHINGQSHYEVDDGAHDISIIGCYAYDTTDDKEPAVYLHTHAGEERIARIAIIGLKSQNTAGIEIDDTDFPLVQDCQIYNSVIGINIVGEVANALIKGNTVYATGYGVYISDDNNSVAVDGNVLQQASMGIYVKDTQTQISLTNNTIIGGERGIKIEAENVYISNNIIYGQTGATYPGLYCSGDKVRFIGNKIENNQGTGNLVKISSDNGVVKDNYISSTGSSALSCSGNNLIIRDNKVEGTQSCISIPAESHTVFIQNNFIIATGTGYGIHLSNANITEQYIDNNYINSYKGIKVEGSGGRIEDNVLNVTTLPIYITGSIDYIFRNIGYITENSGTSTGTGAQQTIAHSLAATPTKVILWDIEDGANPYQSASADATNIYITAVINQDYGWQATAE